MDDCILPQGLRLFEEVQRSRTDWIALSAPQKVCEFRQGELSIACLPVFSQSFLPQLLQPFLARYPDVSLNIVPCESPLLEEWLSAQRHDLDSLRRSIRLREQNVPNYSL